jgi:hypothetical protein
VEIDRYVGKLVVGNTLLAHENRMRNKQSKNTLEEMHMVVNKIDQVFLYIVIASWVFKRSY